MADLVCLKIFTSRIEADLVKGLLQANGIESLIMSDAAAGMYPYLSQSGIAGVRLLVSEKDYPKAKSLLNDLII